MACKYGHHFFRAFGKHWRLVNAKNDNNRLTTVRQLSSTNCHLKSSPGNSTDNDFDLDFFGVESIENCKSDDKHISPAERRWLNSLVRDHVEPKKGQVQVRSKFGYVYEDNGQEKRSETERRSDGRSSSSNSGHNVNSDALESRPSSQFIDYNFQKIPPTFPPQQNRKPFLTEHEKTKNDTMNPDWEKPNATNEMSEIDNQYFPYVTEDRHKPDQSVTFKSAPSEKHLSFIDEQYFENVQSQQNGNLDSVEKLDTRNEMSFLDEQYIGHNNRSEMKEFTKQSEEELNDKTSFFDEQYFNQHINSSSKFNRMETTTETAYLDAQYVENHEIEQGDRRTKHQQPRTKELRHSHTKELRHSQTYDYDSADPESDKADISNEIFGNTRKSHLNRNHETDMSSEDTKPESAFDLAMKIRKQYEAKSGINLVGKFDPKQYDSKGFRILRNQVPHLQSAPSTDIIRVLRKSIIYDDNDIIAITKPYNLPSHGGPGVVHSVESLADKIIPNENLFPVHKLGKETTGVMLLAKNEELADRLSMFIESGRARKRYLTITKNIPELPTGEIDIPIAEGKAGDRTRMCLKPYISPELSPVYKSRVNREKAITRYRMLDTGPKCALLECMPLTSRKHQIRVHLAFGLNCPILGDHKYAHTNTIAPMKLHPEMLKLLRVQQSKVRYIAMHLHYRSIVFPEFFNGRNLYISAPLPPHFLRNLQDLKMKLPRNT